MIILTGKLTFTGSFKVGPITLGGGGPGPGEHRYWRILITESTVNDLWINEMQFRPYMGEDWAPYADGAGASSSFYDGYPAAQAFDADPNTGWYVGETDWNYQTGEVVGPNPPWIGYAFSEPRAIYEVAIQSNQNDGVSGGPGPGTYDVQWSDDGIAWTTAWSVTKQQTQGAYNGEGDYPGDAWVVANAFGGVGIETIGEGGGDPGWGWSELDGGGEQEAQFWTVTGTVALTRDTLVIDRGLERGVNAYIYDDGVNDDIPTFQETTVGDIIDYFNDKLSHPTDASNTYYFDISPEGFLRMTGQSLPTQYGQEWDALMGQPHTRTRRKNYLWKVYRSLRTFSSSSDVVGLNGTTLMLQSDTFNINSATTIGEVITWIRNTSPMWRANLDEAGRLVIANVLGTPVNHLRINNRFPVELMISGGSVDSHGQYLDTFGYPVAYDDFTLQNWVMESQPLPLDGTSSNMVGFTRPPRREVFVIDGTQSLTAATTLKSIYPNYASATTNFRIGIGVMLKMPTYRREMFKQIFPWYASNEAPYENWTVGDGMAIIRQGGDYGEYGTGMFYADVVGGNLRFASLKGYPVVFLQDTVAGGYPEAATALFGSYSYTAYIAQVSRIATYTASTPLLGLSNDIAVTYSLDGTFLGTVGVSGFTTMQHLLNAINGMGAPWSAYIENGKLYVRNDHLNDNSNGLQVLYPGMGSQSRDAQNLWIGAVRDNNLYNGWKDHNGVELEDRVTTEARKWRGFPGGMI